ncbi:hypothetical protein FOZ63_024840 [Perkinsus olseni]|uniref:Uncharacterized protein n=1 Tax=Perkinsus olseni TaxID=32597 RepID=A0A7J6UK05_PEROL|nr:hypothetical protein FOZ63_024840 [Perkinsus olseni]
MPVIVPAEDLPVVEALKEKTAQPPRARAASGGAEEDESVGKAAPGRARRASEGTYVVPARRSLRWCLDDCEDASECTTEREKEPAEGPLIVAEIGRQGRAGQEAEGVDPVGWDAEGSIEEEVQRAVASVEEACQPATAMVLSGAGSQHSVGLIVYQARAESQNSKSEAAIVENGGGSEMRSGRLDEHAFPESISSVEVAERNSVSEVEGSVTTSSSDDVLTGDKSPVSALSVPREMSRLDGRTYEVAEDRTAGTVHVGGEQCLEMREGASDLSEAALPLAGLEDFSVTQNALCMMDDGEKACLAEHEAGLLPTITAGLSSAVPENQMDALRQGAFSLIATEFTGKYGDDRDSVSSMSSSDGGDTDWETVKSRAKVRILRAIQVLLAVLALQVLPPLLLYIDPPDFSRN